MKGWSLSSLTGPATPLTVLVRIVGVALILAGLFVGGRSVYGLMHQESKDTAQDQAWQSFIGAAAGEARAEASPSPGASPPAATSGVPGGLYMKLTVPKLSKDAVGVDGDWNSLKQVSLVHYRDSPAPGQKGNVLVAFHRETHWLDIDKLGAGDQVLVQTTDGKTYSYAIDFVKTIKPSDTSLLKPTQGDDLTLITCDPPWQDYDRMVFRGHLVPASPTP
jgi:sortase A